MDHDANMIRVLESRCAALEGGIGEVPLLIIRVIFITNTFRYMKTVQPENRSFTY
jgi:hypothetical protein